MPRTNELVRYRGCTARLLTKSVAMTRQLEGRLGGGDAEALSLKDIHRTADPSAAFRITNALLLRKAWIHVAAVLRANESSNLHSLAVQMRPVLECAGQIVFTFRNLVIVPNLTTTPERAFDIVGDRTDADYYRTVISATKGQVGHGELLDELSSVREKITGQRMPRRRWKRLQQTDKVATLAEGTGWYDHLSEYFCHGRADWRGDSWQGGVVSINSALDEFTFASFMDYLVRQVAVMNAYAALCPNTGADRERWVEATLSQVCFVRERSQAARDRALSSFTWPVAATED